jgi:dihydropteroate synthase
MTPRPTFDLEIGHLKVRLGERTLIMGAFNVTPDSFSDGGLYIDPAKAVEHGLELVGQGADWIDVGGESTRPGSQPVSVEEELRRVLPVIRTLRSKLRTTPISIDTTKAEVAEKAVQAGASILNDVSGLRFDPRLADVARSYKTPLILMHLRGRPETMQTRPFVRDILQSLNRGLARSLQRALAAGLRRSQLILDPGLGFGKSRFQNFEILAHLGKLHRFGLPILVGTSRKSSPALVFMLPPCTALEAEVVVRLTGRCLRISRRSKRLLFNWATPPWWWHQSWLAPTSCACMMSPQFCRRCASRMPCSPPPGRQ